MDAFSVGRGAGALKGAACDEYRRAHAAYLQGMADAAAVPVWKLLGELLAGFAESYAGGLGSAGMRDAIAFAVMIAMLLARPEGLFGRSVRV